AAIPKQPLPPSVLLRAQAHVDALADHDQHLFVQAFVIQVSPQGNHANFVVTINCRVKNRHAFVVGQCRRPRQPAHAYHRAPIDLLPCNTRKIEQRRINLLYTEILAIAGPRFQHNLRIKGRVDAQTAIAIELDAGLEHLGRLEQGAVIDLLRNLTDGLVVVPAVDQQQGDGAWYEQYQQPEVHAAPRLAG